METLQADVVVIGMGPGGEDVAGRLAEAGLDVVGVERELVGGECPYWGCVPTKMMIRAANLLAEGRRVRGMAGDATVRPDWAPVAQRIRDEATDDWDDRVAVERFEGKGGRFLRGEGRIVAPGPSGGGSGKHARVAVGDRVIEVRRGIVVATGTHATIPPIPGLRRVPYWTNREAIEAKELPSSLLVLGGGAVGAELAQAFARFGVDVTVVELLEQLVPGEEPEAGELLADVFGREGIAVHTGASATEVRRDGARVTVTLADGTTLAAAQILVAIGRRADLAAAGLSVVGIDESQPWVPVDDRLRVTDGVWAVGDITGQGAFTHVAMYQSPIAVADILGQDHAPADYRAMPRATFTDPEIGAVGLTEAQARDARIDVRVGATRVPQTARGWIHKAGNDGVIKLVEDAGRGVLVGATAMGPTGGEILGLLTLAVHAEVPTDRLRDMIYAYPTFHRGVEDALRDLAC
jgi:pyruvate/2-oxoglutarate dehydrogenase complex dihydrolipoamide dehydrogenase (E3) component